MRLSSLELQGFKSFPDRTRLEFESGITAVVGPNGSGKSNIADAVRWVFGEQSTRTLRGNKMEDVIFGGTQTRKAVGYASVQLTIDNSDHAFPDQDEVITISRRLYRSGESEYRIGGNAVRLKDIHELFMDTGLGRDGYSIIGQGKIADIVSAKSGQRREIFEEAAGISKFRYRRAEAERRLEQSEENLVRLRDILGELEDRVGPLRIQSEKAKQYLKLAEERKTLEVSLWMLSLTDLKTQLAEQENKVYIAKNDYERLEMESAALEEELAGIYREMQGYSAEADSLRGEIRTLEEQLSKSESQVAVMYNDIAHNRQNIQRLEDELKEAGTSREEIEAQLVQKKREQETARQELVLMQGRIDAAEQRLREQKELVARTDESLGQLEVRRETAEEAVSAIRLEQAASTSLMQESVRRLEELRESSTSRDQAVETIQSGITECRLQIEELKEKESSLSNTQQGYALKAQSRERKRDEVREKCDAILQKAEASRSRAKLLEDMEKNMEGFQGSVRYILDQASRGALKGVYGAVSSLISTQASYTTAIETALGAALQNIVVENENTAKQAMRMLQSAKAGRATFLPVTTYQGTAMSDRDLRDYHGFIGVASSLVQADSRFEGILRRLLGRVCIVEDLDSGTAMARGTGYKFRIVTLDGQVINAGGSFTGGSTVRSAGMLGRRNEIDRLKAQEQEYRQQAEAMEPELQAVAEELSKLEAAISGTAGELQSAQEEQVRLGFALEQMEKNLETEQHNRELARNEVEQLAQRLRGIQQGEADKDRMMEELTAQLTALQEEMKQVEERRATLMVGSETASQQLSEMQLARLSAEKDLETMVAEIARLEDQTGNADQRSGQLREELAVLEAKNTEIETAIETTKEQKGELHTQVAAHNERITTLMQKRTELEGKTTQLRAKEKEYLANREEVSKELARLEERRRAVQLEYDGIITKLWDEYELTRSKAAEVAVELPDRNASQRRLGELRSKIRSIGTVNVDAIEEYAQVSERYEFLRAQVKDVEEAKSRLHKLITELTDEMKQIFADNFSKIAHQFSKIFTELFGGGRGDLSLSDPDDVLESGIDINVQPPGKVIKNLSLLSGGEQSFVAIAIYFAILKVKPAPFCLLDEIEAALDDVNVTRFANYLRQMCDKTQFIAITHRRGTMEEADVLYGVTMQEEGVSKILELKLGEVESKLGMGAE